MAARENKSHQVKIILDPSKDKNQVYVGNLPHYTHNELERISLSYGNTRGQFESEEATSSLNKSTFNGNVLTVRNAGLKQSQNIKRDETATTQLIDTDYNDCEILVINKNSTKYAEMIESRLRKFGLRVDVLFPHDNYPLGKLLAIISSRGCLYAIVVTSQLEKLNSITVNILYGLPTEHRNMPTEDAIKLIHDDFQAKKYREDKHNVFFRRDRRASPLISTTSLVPRLNERHPEDIQVLLNSLASNKSLTTLQYECVIKYLKEKKRFLTNAINPAIG